MEQAAWEVNKKFGDDVSRALYEASVLSRENRPGMVVEMHPSFSGWRAIRPDYKPADCYESIGSDGVGTKVEVAERLEDFSTVAHDLFAMAADDAVVRGAEPVAISTVLDVNRLLDDDILTAKAIGQLAMGYVEAARGANIVILNGETAELGSRVGGFGDFNLNWSGTVLWYAQKDRILTGHTIKPGDSLIGLREEGFRSNGLTDVRKAMDIQYGPTWHNVVLPELGAQTLGRLVQHPSRIYTPLITALTGGFDAHKEPKAQITGVAHITGGGIPRKLGDMLKPTGLGAEISNPFDPPAIMLHVQKLLGISDAEAYSNWHMGSGMIVATPEPNRALREAQSQGVEAKQIGFITDEPGIRVANRGNVGDEEFKNF